MKIAVVDVAASVGGALSVLNDFCDTIRKRRDENTWYILTSVIKIQESDNIINLQYPEVKKSWWSRIHWEKNVFPELMRKYEIDVVFSLQNSALLGGNYKQIVYFHNVLLLQKIGTFVNLKMCDLQNAIRVNILGPYTRKTWKNADIIIVQENFVKELISKYYDENKVVVVRPNVNIEQTSEEISTSICGYIYPASALSYKNIEALIEAERSLNKQNKEINIMITIQGNENSYARRMVKKAKNVRGIRFIGRQDRKKLYELYKNYGLIMTSRLESFGMPIIEAMQSGTVVIGLDKEYFTEIANGYSRAYVALEEDNLPEIMEKGLRDTKAGNYVNENNEGWESVIDIIVGKGTYES